MTEKTQTMRLLEAAGIDYKIHQFESTDAMSAIEVARLLGQDPLALFKTLVTVGKSGKHYVFMLPAPAELDLKKAARASGEKAIEMIKQKELLPLTGYVHGACSPIGMKKLLPTFIDEIALASETIFFSAGKFGLQFEMPLSSLQKIVPVETCDLTA